MLGNISVNRLREFRYPKFTKTIKDIFYKIYLERRERKKLKDILILENAKLKTKLFQKELELDVLIKRTNRKLKEASQSHSCYFSDLSHEIKTPLAIIKNYLIVATEGGRLDIEAVFGQVQNLTRTIEDVIFISKLDNTLLRLEIKRLNLTNVIKDICDELEPIALDRKIGLKNCLKEEIYVFADQEKLRRAFLEIIQNAILYNQSGGVIEVGGHAGKKEARVTVLDTGAGIKKKDQAKIFTCFYRSFNARQVADSGNGLGLLITRKIIKKHKGTIRIKSKQGKGTAVVVELPIKSRRP